MKYLITFLFLIMVGGAAAQQSPPQEYPYIHYIDSVKVMTLTHTQAVKLDIKADLADHRKQVINEQDILIEQYDQLILNQSLMLTTQKEIIITQEERFATQQELNDNLQKTIKNQKRKERIVYIISGAVIGSILLFR